jgi:hypothetical protein
MRGQRRLRPSPSMLVAFAALMVALGGTSYAVAQLPAGSVGTKQLKKNAVNAAKVKDRSLLAKDFKSGQLPRGAQGPRGVSGPAGPRGAAGPQGPPGPPAVSSLTVREGELDTGFSFAACGQDEVAIGGGGITEETDAFLYESAPDVAAGVPTGWFASARFADGAGTEAAVTAYVICAAP